MIRVSTTLLHLVILTGTVGSLVNAAEIQFAFDGDIVGDGYTFSGRAASFSDGIDGQALVMKPDPGYSHLSLQGLPLDGTSDFTVQCWIRTTSDKPTVFLSCKDFPRKGITAQKNPGWVLYSSGGTFAWSVGSGDRRVTYERDNGSKMPINDGRWHQLTLTFNQALSEFRLYYDGINRAVYHVGFPFAGGEPLVIGAIGDGLHPPNTFLPEIEEGSQRVQAVVDAFNRTGVGPVEPEEVISLIVDPRGVYEEKRRREGDGLGGSDPDAFERVLSARRKLGSNPYTVFQNRALTNLKPISKLYGLDEGRVVIREPAARSFTDAEKLYPTDCSLDALSIRDDTLSANEVMETYRRHRGPGPVQAEKNDRILTVGIWNIWHGGIHWSPDRDGWDSRLRIVEILQEHQVDIVLMQETYSSGDYIAAELGHCFAASSDWDYCFQGANLSVLSRFPIESLHVNTDTEFNYLGATLAVSKTRKIHAMSNWYGMDQFSKVYDFNQARFDAADVIPVLFGGDFNAVPHTDGGRSPASRTLLDAGFTDAFRSLYPDVASNPGYSHRSGRRIDQLYYTGRRLRNLRTNVIAEWPGGFPSDHFLIVSTFDMGE